MTSKLAQAQALNIPVCSPEAFVRLSDDPLVPIYPQWEKPSLDRLAAKVAEGFFDSVEHRVNRVDDHLVRVCTVFVRQGRRWANVWRITRSLWAVPEDVSIIQRLCAVEGAMLVMRYES